MAYDQRGLIQCSNNISHGKRLTRTRYTLQCLKLIAGFKSIYQFLDRLRLITCWFIFRIKLKIHIQTALIYNLSFEHIFDNNSLYHIFSNCKHEMMPL